MTTEPTDPLAGIPETDAQKIIRAAEDAEASAVIDENLDPSKARPEGEAYRGALAAGAAAYRAKHVDPRGAKGEPSDDMAIARRMPIAALVAVLAERGEPGDVTAEDLEEVHGLADQESISAFMTTWQARHGRTNTQNICGNPQSAWEFYAAMQTIVPRLAREVAILRALAAHELPCGHKLADIVYGGPDLNGLPTIAQCGQCLADRQAAKAALPRTPERVLRAMLAAYREDKLRSAIELIRAHRAGNHSFPSGTLVRRRAEVADLHGLLVSTIVTGRPCMFRKESLRTDYQARLAGTRPLDAPPPEAP